MILLNAAPEQVAERVEGRVAGRVWAGVRLSGLLPVLRDIIGFEMDVWIAMHKDLKSSRRVRLMFDHLAVHLQAYIRSESS